MHQRLDWFRFNIDAVGGYERLRVECHATQAVAAIT